ncbi:hypothetical protein A0J61_06724 [Choanephora cucurbitarum]|uniref:Uncharacterized protein n=1 Tax=Choanephora cucurbitarum TaxID=101091 RepID=A0A1C7N9B5_9FUNG|nr:hypothetical protein A0J61_06724 [Choanephora cucurbitarum]
MFQTSNENWDVFINQHLFPFLESFYLLDEKLSYRKPFDIISCATITSGSEQVVTRGCRPTHRSDDQ